MLAAALTGVIVFGIYAGIATFFSWQAERRAEAEYEAVYAAIRKADESTKVALVDQRALAPTGFVYYLGMRNEVRTLVYQAGSLRRLRSLDGRSGGQAEFVGARYQVRNGAFLDNEDLIETSGRAHLVEFSANGNDYVFFVGREDVSRSALALPILLALLAGWGAGSLFSIAGALMTAYSVNRLINGIQATTDEIIKGDLSRRVPVRHPREEKQDEVDRLSATINRLLDQIERLHTGMKEVSDNIAHDLRTPLSRLRGRLEGALVAVEDGRAPVRTIAGDLEESLGEADQLLATFNALLSIARLEAGAMRENMQTLEVSSLLTDLVELYAPLAEEQGLRLDFECPPSLHLRGNRELVGQALSNLIENAIKYSRAGGRIRVEGGAMPMLRGRKAGVKIIVSDEGPGIPEADRARVLERFVRLEKDRSTPGNGLGLSLVAAIAVLHEARLELGDGPGGRGLKVTLSFPPA